MPQGCLSRCYRMKRHGPKTAPSTDFLTLNVIGGLENLDGLAGPRELVHG